MIEITELTSDNFKSNCTVKVGDTPGELMQNVSDILNSRNTSNELLKEIVNKLNEHFTISTEFIRYCLLTEKHNHIDSVDLMYTNYGKHGVKKQMRKFYRFLKKNNIPIETKNGYYKRLMLWSGNLKKFTVARSVHTLDLNKAVPE